MMEARPQVIGLSTPGDCIPWLAHGSEREEGTYILGDGGGIARVSRRRGLRTKSKNKMKKKRRVTLDVPVMIRGRRLEKTKDSYEKQSTMLDVSCSPE